jgi:hypothetical protein
MKKYLLLFAILVATVLVSCEEDDPVPPPHEVGTWNLQNYALLNLPSDFQRYEGRTLQLSVFGTEAYQLNLFANKTFEREIQTSGSLPQEDAGTYTLEEDELTLKSDDDSSDDEVYGLEKNKNNRLWLTLPIETLLLKDAIADTITQEYINSISEQEFEDLHDVVSLDLVFAFEKEEVQ